ncbi:hypothetical protein J7L02_01175, partial [Candidatus Woesearchaeota archaeon]|nr:hypothetical protein [Candidatus Woesearchaeota archaeon]
MRWGVLIVLVVLMFVVYSGVVFGEYVFNDCFMFFYPSSDSGLDVRVGKGGVGKGLVLNPGFGKDWNINHSNANTYFFEDFESYEVNTTPENWTIVNGNEDNYSFYIVSGYNMKDHDINGGYGWPEDCRPPLFTNKFLYYSDDDAGRYDPPTVEKAVRNVTIPDNVTNPNALMLMFSWGFRQYMDWPWDYIMVKVNSQEVWSKYNESHGVAVINISNFYAQGVRNYTLSFEYHDPDAAWGFAVGYDNIRVYCPGNGTPSISLKNNYTVEEDSTLTITINVSDPDNDPLFIYTNAAEMLPEDPQNNNWNMEYSLHFNYWDVVFKWTPRFGEAGVYNVSFNVTDLLGWAFANTTIIVVPYNPPPVFHNLSNNYTLAENQTFVLRLNATDENDENLTYYTNAGEVLPSQFSFNQSTGVFNWTPSFCDSGSYNVTFIASDGRKNTSKTVTFNVLEVLDPVVVSIPPGRVRVLELFEYQLRVVPWVDGLEFYLVEGPQGMHVNQSGFVSWFP